MGEISLSCYSAPWSKLGIVKAITDIADCGFDGIECPSDIVYSYEDRLHVFEEILESSNLKLSGLLQTINLFDKDKADEQVERAANSARFLGAASKNGCLTICQSFSHLDDPTEDEWITIAAIIEEIGFRCQDFKVNFCFMPRAGYFGFTLSQLKRLFAMVDSSVLSLSIDTSEILLSNLDIIKLLKDYSKFIFNVRFRDVTLPAKYSLSDFHRFLSSPEFGKGSVKFDQVSKCLLEINYSGWLTLDTSGESQGAYDSASNGYRYIMRKSGIYPY